MYVGCKGALSEYTYTFNLECCPEHMSYLWIILLFLQRSLRLWLTRKCPPLCYLYADMPAAGYRSGCFSTSTIPQASPCVTATSTQKKICYHLTREEVRYSSWCDLPIQGNNSGTLLSWSVDRHQSWKIGQQRLFTGVWVNIEITGAAVLTFIKWLILWQTKVGFGTECDLLSLILSFVAGKRTRFFLLVAKLNSSRPGCRHNLFLGEESCPPWLVDGLVALAHTICAPIIK